ncbi:MAG: AAA family ATPase [Sphingomonadales bacterium]|nr:AAA family ATPase [Sphingomonadales bacterium]MDE2172154.1 AAA family ATPase [Sphingomonadales bacterium]
MTMGRADHQFSAVQDARNGQAADIALVVSAHFARGIGRLDDARLAGLKIHEAMPGEPLASLHDARIDLMVMEVAPGEPASLERLSQFHARHPDVPIIAAIHDASLALVRRLLHEGVADVVGLPFDREELSGAMVQVLSQSARRNVDTPRLAPMVAVMQSIGGCGATTIATHLAAALSGAGEGRGVAMVDLDLQFGSVAESLSANGRGSVQDLIEAGNRLDAELVAAIARSGPSGIDVFAAPEEIRVLEDVSTERLIAVLDLLRRHYRHVVLDLPSNITNWLIVSLMGADAIVMVVEMSIASLRQAQRRLNLLRSIGIPPEQIHIVVNRVERRLFRTIGLDDVAQTLGQPVLGSVALEAPVVTSARDRGELVSGRRSRFVSDIDAIATRLGGIWQGEVA